MGNAYDEFAIDDDGQTPGKTEGGKLREKLEKAIDALKEKDKLITELQKTQTQFNVSKYLKDVPEKFHKLAQRELAENPTDEGFVAFVKEYGDLWGAEQSEQVDPEEAVVRAAMEKIQAAQNEARNVDSNGQPRMPSPRDFQNMSYSDAQKLAQDALASWKKS